MLDLSKVPCIVQFHLNDGEPVAMSIPATEHSVMTAWRTEREALENMIEQFGTGIFACVMDSYDYVEVSNSLSALLFSNMCQWQLADQQVQHQSAFHSSLSHIAVNQPRPFCNPPVCHFLGHLCVIALDTCALQATLLLAATCTASQAC